MTQLGCFKRGSQKLLRRSFGLPTPKLACAQEVPRAAGGGNAPRGDGHGTHEASWLHRGPLSGGVGYGSVFLVGLPPYPLLGGVKENNQIPFWGCPKQRHTGIFPRISEADEATFLVHGEPSRLLR